MRKMFMSLASILLISHFSFAFAAEPNMGKVQPPSMAPQRGGTIPQLQLTPDYLYKQIMALQQQVAGLQAQVNALRSVVQVTQNGATIQAAYLTINGQNNLAMISSKKINLTAGDDLTLTSGKDMSLQSQKDVTAEGAGKIRIKAPQIKLNDGSQPLAVVGSSVSGGKVINGSVSVFVK